MAKALSLGFDFRNKRFDDAALGLRYFSKTLNQDFRKLGPVMGAELRHVLEAVAEAMAQRHGNPWPDGTTTHTLSRRSGAGLESIKNSVRVIGKTLNSMKGEIGGNFYMRVQEYGATIKPRKVKWLTIPLPAALNKNGTPKKRSAREWSNTFIAQSKAGNLIIFRKDGAEVVPLYVLKKKVVIPPRLGMRDTIDTAIPYFIEQAMDRMVRELQPAT